MSPVLTAPVVSTQWLADHVGADDMVVVDASVLALRDDEGTLTGRYVGGHDQYLAHGHVPGAVFADLVVDLSDDRGALPFTRPSTERFAAAAGALGIANHVTVVVYDSGAGHWASRLWWLFRAAGYDDVAVLEGGFSTWLAEGRPVDVGHVEPTPARFVAHERPDLWVDKAFVERVVAGDEQAALVCASPRSEFDGLTGRRPRLGHIPGSVSVPADELVGDDRRVDRPARLREAFAPVLDAERIVLYCGAGISAATDALALTLLGVRDVSLYDGSLDEWAADAEAPLLTAA
jgi:thiosulfate/3-mercaptopyruvate sulfurtransferase